MKNDVSEDYVHRIGRTAWAGAVGITIALCSDEGRPYLRSLEMLTRRSVPQVSMASIAGRADARRAYRIAVRAANAPN